MSELSELNREYLALAQTGEGGFLELEYERIVEYMKNSCAIHHGEYVRTCYAPKLFTTAVFEGFSADIRLLYGIFEKVFAAYYADPAYRALFGFSPELEALILRSDWRAAMLPMARIDFFYNDETGAYKFCEFNTDGTSAMIEDRELNHAQKLSTAHREFTARHRCHTAELFDSWVEAFCGVYRRRRGADAPPPRVAIVDYMECGSTNEFELFREHFAAKGMECQVCDVRYLHYDGKTLTGPDDEPIDAIYRRAVTADVLAHWEESQALLEAVRADAVVLLGDFHTQIVHNKTLFRVLQAPATQALLTTEEQAFVREHVPYTAALCDCPPELLEQVRRNKDGWILKPQDSYGSRGIHAGVESDQAQWEQILRGLDTPEARQNYILQEFYTPYVTENYGYVDGEVRRTTYYNLTGVYVYDGVPAGVYSRVSLSPIISTQYSEKTLPTLFVEE